MQVTVIGTGFVGVVTAAVLSSFGNTVRGLDVDLKKVESLQKGEVPFFEPGLKELLQQAIQTGNLTFTTDYQQAITGSQVIIVAVGTPSAPDGTADLTYVKKACESLAPYIAANTVICIKSTVPPGSFAEIQPILAAHTTQPFALASLPEFLREGSAVEDTLHPDRVVIGCDDSNAREVLKALHEPFAAPIFMVSTESAQMGKYAANSYLATRISFINQIADLCEQNGANVQEVIQVIGADERIGTHYWYPGLGYGGSCFPKDVRELAAYSRTVGYGNNLFNKIHELNESRVYEKLNLYEKFIGGWQDKTVAVLGLSFKKNTDDMREAPSTKIIPDILHKGAQVIGYDPMALPVAKQVLAPHARLSFVSDIALACQQADVVIALIEWPEIVQYPFESLPPTQKQRFFLDMRNQFDDAKLRQAGWKYISIGKGKLNV